MEDFTDLLSNNFIGTFSGSSKGSRVGIQNDRIRGNNEGGILHGCKDILPFLNSTTQLLIGFDLFGYINAEKNKTDFAVLNILANGTMPSNDLFVILLG